MSVFRLSASKFSGMELAPNERELPVTTTGVPLSDRFKVIQHQGGGHSHYKFAQGGIGYGSPSNCLHSESGDDTSYNDVKSISTKNKLLAASFGRRTEALLMRNKLLAGKNGSVYQGNKRGSIRNVLGRGLIRGGSGVNTAGQNNPIFPSGASVFTGLRSGIVGNVRGGFVTKKNAVRVRGRSGIVARGGRGGGRLGTSPLNRDAGGSGNSNWFGAPRSKIDLDKELDAYMSQSKTKKKSDLDQELDEYMRIAREQSLMSSATTAAGTTENVEEVVELEDADITMTDDA